MGCGQCFDLDTNVDVIKHHGMNRPRQASILWIACCSCAGWRHGALSWLILWRIAYGIAHESHRADPLILLGVLEHNGISKDTVQLSSHGILKFDYIAHALSPT